MIKIKVDKRGFARIIARVKEEVLEGASLGLQETAHNVKNIAKDIVCDKYELEPSMFYIPDFYDEDIDIDETTARINISGEEIPLEKGFYLDAPYHTARGDSVYYKIRKGVTEEFPSYGFVAKGRTWKRKTSRSSPYFKYGTPSIPDMISNQGAEFLSAVAENFEENINSHLENI